MKSRDITSDSESRVCLATNATPPAARVSTGNAMLRSQGPGSVPSGAYPVAGNAWTLTASSSTSTRASQKFGSASPASDTTSTSRPSAPPRSALTVPRLTPTRPETITVPTMMDRLGPSRAFSSCMTGWPLNRSAPRLPCSTPSSQCQYCTGSG